MSGDKENEYFSDGLTETLLHMLAQLPDLRVAARTSSFAFKGRNTSIDEIASTLGVAHILEGSVQKSGERVRITAQLIRANDGFHVWSQNYTRPLEDIFAIQDEIADDVADALGSSLLGNQIPDLQGVSTSDLTAYDSYLKALEQQVKFSYGSLATAESHLKQALARDPEFTDARLSLVRNHFLKYDTGLIKQEELKTQADPLIQQVRTQHPDNRFGRAFELLLIPATSPGIDNKEREAITLQLRALLPLIPTETFLRLAVAFNMAFFFDQDQQASEVLEAGLLIDPMADDLHSQLGSVYIEMNRMEDARTELERALELAPDNPNSYARLGDLEKELNNLPAGLEWFRRATEVDPQDHELAREIAVDLYRLNLTESGDQWRARVQALAPASAVGRMVELERAMAKKEFDLALEISRSMISDQVEFRQGAYADAVFTHADLMLESGRAKEGFDFLVSVRPEIANFDITPEDLKGMLMQWTAIGLMSGFESFETRKQAWLKLAEGLDASGFPWRDQDNANLTWDMFITGDLEGAIDHHLNNYLSLPLANNLQRHQRRFNGLFSDLYDDPRVSVRLTELDREFEQLRDEVSELMLEPEWNQ